MSFPRKQYCHSRVGGNPDLLSVGCHSEGSGKVSKQTKFSEAQLHISEACVQRHAPPLRAEDAVRHIFSPARLFLHVENAGEDGEAVIRYLHIKETSKYFLLQD